MKDDVRFTVKKNKQGALYVSVKGGSIPVISGIWLMMVI